MSREMSRSEDATGALWGAFMRCREEVKGRLTDEFIPMQIFPEGPGQLADPSARFTKWAAVEVENFDEVPDGMAAYTLGRGTYAVFNHHGAATDLSTFMYIFSEWLPGSVSHELDDREHFEVLPPGYQALDPDAREEIWVPVRKKV